MNCSQWDIRRRRRKEKNINVVDIATICSETLQGIYLLCVNYKPVNCFSFTLNSLSCVFIHSYAYFANTHRFKFTHDFNSVSLAMYVCMHLTILFCKYSFSVNYKVMLNLFIPLLFARWKFKMIIFWI